MTQSATSWSQVTCPRTQRAPSHRHLRRRDRQERPNNGKAAQPSADTEIFAVPFIPAGAEEESRRWSTNRAQGGRAPQASFFALGLLSRRLGWSYEGWIWEKRARRSAGGGRLPTRAGDAARGTLARSRAIEARRPKGAAACFLLFPVSLLASCPRDHGARGRECVGAR